MIQCKTPYSADVAKSGKHEPLTLYIAVYAYNQYGALWFGNGREIGFVWGKVPNEFATLKEAQQYFKKFIADNPDKAKLIKEI